MTDARQARDATLTPRDDSARDDPPRDDASRPFLEVQGLTKRFPSGRSGRWGRAHRSQIHALEDVSFRLLRGHVSALVGESGSGKSTTARLIARLLPPTSGTILLDGTDVLREEPRGASLAYRRRVQMIFQDPFASLNPVHTIRHHLERPLIVHGKATAERDVARRVDELLTTVGLDPPLEFAAKRPHELSGGQRQRIAIARALAVEPDLVLADEPVSMLDVSIRIGILNLMQKLKEQHRISQVFITHDIATARYIADDIMVMYAGHLVESAPSDALVSHPAHPYTQTLLAAVPDPQRPLRRREGDAKRGDVPSLVDPSPGCPFAARCPKVMSACRTAMPAATSIAKGHMVRCHLFPG